MSEQAAAEAAILPAKAKKAPATSVAGAPGGLEVAATAAPTDERPDKDKNVYLQNRLAVFHLVDAINE